jgi:CHAT domain-containing protein
MKRLMRCMAVAVIVLFQAWDTASGEQPRNIDEEIKATWTSVFNGHLNDAIARATKLLSEIDPAQDGDGYWRASSSLVEILQELENDTLADKMLGVMVQKKIAENPPARRVWMQYYLGRDLVRLGHREQGEQLLRTLTAGDERQVYFPAQRFAAIFMSKIEFDHGNIDQSAIWMRRAVIGILISKDATPIDILDVLTEYAAHLALTRRPLDALALYARLEPIYRVGIQKHSPKYIRFTAQYLQTLTTVGAYAVADRALAEPKEAVQGVDILPPTITETIFSQDLYQAARSVPQNGPSPVIERLKKLTADYPDLLKSPGFRIAFSYFALLGGDFQLADQYARASQPEQSENTQMRAYDLLLQSLAAAGQKDFPRSLRLAREGVEQLHLFLREFEPLSSNWSPTLRSEERVVLAAILGVNAEKLTNAEDKNTLFDIAQLLNSDRSKLGLTARISRQALKLDLQREDLRTRDRLRDVRDRLMDEAVRTLITRIVTPPKKDQSSPPKVDASPMQRLEEIEDKIVIADQQTQNVYKHISQKLLTDIEDVRDILRPDEALVLHNISPLGIAQICIVGDGVVFHFEPLPIDKAKQVGIDEKLILAAVHAEYAPSPVLDESFPSDSAYRLYTLLFGGIEDCIKSKSHLLLATDPDIFAFPFNALLTAPTAPGAPFSNRNAAWLPRSYAISLLPSVRAIYELRVNVLPSQARQKFLGVGDPELRGPQRPGTQLSLRSLYVERGVANLSALQDLPPLPESTKELRVVSAALSAPDDSLLLGRDATERALRNRPLNDYRVISFATHALVAGDIEGISEPALVLTPGSEATPANDGLLTATEIANLDLDTNLVILSACNTAAADGAASGRGLSGLANAFFFAGARSVAVTQWAVFSEVAQTLGTGLITRSAGPDGVGVAEALRRTMVYYFSNAREDYRAHPRFWAAFSIAGDGAIRPLDGGTVHDRGGETVKVINDHLTPDPSQLEFAGLAKIPSTSAIYAVGRLKPASGTQFAGSYLARLDHTGGPDVIAVDPAIAAGPISTVRNGMILLENTYSQDRLMAALFRLIDNSGKEIWRFTEDSPVQDVPIGAVEVSKGYLLLSTAEDWSGSSSPLPSKLVINLVSPTGELLSRREYVVADRALSSTPPGLVVKGRNGDLIVVINKLRSSVEEKQPGWILNPLTGSRRFCLSGNMATFLDIDVDTLEIRSTADTHGRVAKAIKTHDGEIFVAFSTTHECRLQHGVELAKLNAALQTETVLKYEGVNDIELWDFAPLGNSFVLSGSVRVQLPTTLLREVIPLSQLTSPFDPAFWERGEEPPNAFILIGSADGAVTGDRVFPDLLNRSVNRIVASGPREVVGVGAALGDRGWVVVLEADASRTVGAGARSSTELQH